MISKIAHLLEEHLQTFATQENLQVVYENIKVKPENEIYLICNILPGITTNFDLEGKLRTYKGVFQVSVVTPINTGKESVHSIVDAIIEHFPLNLELKQDNFSLYINSIPSAYPVVKEKSTYTIPISMNYRADILI